MGQTGDPGPGAPAPAALPLSGWLIAPGETRDAVRRHKLFIWGRGDHKLIPGPNPRAPVWQARRRAGHPGHSSSGQTRRTRSTATKPVAPRRPACRRGSGAAWPGCEPRGRGCGDERPGGCPGTAEQPPRQAAPARPACGDRCRELLKRRGLYSSGKTLRPRRRRIVSRG